MVHDCIFYLGLQCFYAKLAELYEVLLSLIQFKEYKRLFTCVTVVLSVIRRLVIRVSYS